MAIPVLVNNTGFNGGNAAAFYDITLGWTPAVGEELRIMVHAATASNTFGTITLTGVPSWTTDVTTDTGRRSRIYRGVVTSSVSGNLRINTASGNFTGNISGNVSGWTGLPISGGFVAASSSANNGTGTALTTNASTAPANRDYLVIATLSATSGNPASATGGFTLLTAGVSGQLVGYKLVTGSGSPSAETFAATSGISGTWTGLIAVYALGTLNVSVQPTNLASVPNNFSPTVKCQAFSDGSVIDTNVTLACTATVNSGGGTLSGTANPSAVAGEATFTGLGMSAGTGAQTLAFGMTGYMPQVSSSFTIGTAVALKASLLLK